MVGNVDIPIMASANIYVTRLTWNINGWNRPSGARAKESSNVTKNGFGMEEWLNRSECEVNGWRFAFLEGVHKSRQRLTGQKLRILLYSIPPNGGRVYVGELKSAEVIDNTTEKQALDVFRRRGLLETMKREIAEAGGKKQSFRGGTNIRFRPDALSIYKIPIPAKSWDRILRFNRYSVIRAGTREAAWWKATSGKRKPWITPPSTDPVVYERAARLVTMEFIEKKMQREIKAILEKHFGSGTVEAERNHRDLKLKTEHRRALIEIKAAEDARLAIREAFGQLLEYAYFDPVNREGGDELFVVGRGAPTHKAQQYLDYLRSRFGLQITYLSYHIGTNQLDPAGKLV